MLLIILTMLTRDFCISSTGLCCMLPSVQDYTSHLRDATTVERAIK